jgi:hypothetical protein
MVEVGKLLRIVMINVKAIAAGAGVTVGLACTAVGLGSGVASADQPLPSTPGVTWKLDHGQGHGHDDWDWDHRATGVAEAIGTVVGATDAADVPGFHPPYGSGCRLRCGADRLSGYVCEAQSVASASKISR